MDAGNTRLVALLHGPDQTGLVARVAGWIFESGGNIIHADQHRDEEEGIFFQRVEWAPATGDTANAAAEFSRFAESLGMNVRVADSRYRPRIALMVSKSDHCFHDLVLRAKAGEFSGDVVGVISNHPDLESAAAAYGLPFSFVPVEKGNKEAAEDRQLQIIRELRVDVVVLARYMQILSNRFLQAAGCPVINIHHSFLPAFAGGRPYHQAHARGVKLIGATAHYATADLDEGPIIAQDVTRVTHRHDVRELTRKGRDLEKSVLAQALRWHLENRILVYNNKTVVFD
jgi:formyltetrahydrofolate deformylase